MAFLSNLFGGASRKKAAEEGQVAQTRQLSAISSDTARTMLSRRNPRGRKLLADTERNALQTTVA